MNCDKCKELLVPLIHNLLKDEHKQAAVEHIKHCAACLAEFKATKALHDRLTGNGKAVAQKDLVDAVWEQISQKDSVRISAVMQQRNAEQAPAAEQATEALQTRRNLMNSPISKLAAAAAVVMVGVLLSYAFIFGPGTTVTLGAVLAKINSVAAYAYEMNMDMTGFEGMPGMDSNGLSLTNEAIMAPELGIKVISRHNGKVVAESYISIVDGKVISVMPEAKLYMTMQFSEDLVEKMREDNNDPRTMVEQFMECAYTEIGTDTIDGVEVVGFESNDPNITKGVLGNVSAIIWIDAKTNLPVKYEMEASDDGGNQMISMVIENFEWDLEVDADMFTPVIPEDFKLMGDVQIAVDENTMASGLAFYAELTGKYPEEMNPIKMVKDLQEGLMNSMMNKAESIAEDIEENGEENSEENGARNSAMRTSAEELTKGMMQKVMNLTMSATFYGTMKAEGKDPAYYGDKVTPDFPDAVLMRWKEEDGTYKVIFGNLTIGEATAEELAELEAAPLNPKPEAIMPTPADSAAGLSHADVTLAWIPGAYVTDHKVYFGDDQANLTLLADVAVDSNTVAPEMERNTTYYWRVDEVQQDGSVAVGDVWSLSTGGLVAHYALDETTGTSVGDSADNPVGGQLEGDPAWTAGHIGGALEFDGDGDFVMLSHDPKFEITGSITVSAWIKVNVFDREWQTIISKGDRSWRLQRNRDKDNLEFGCFGLMVPGSQYGSVYGKTAVNDGNWHHALGVYDGTQIALYVDGKLDASVETSGKVSIGKGFPVLVGSNSGKEDRYWNGLIDDVRIYNCALSQDEIEAMAN